MNLRVLIAEDELLCRERLRAFLEAEPLVEIVAECVTGSEALEAIRRINPDIVFLDVRMPDCDGFTVIERLQGFRLPVIIFVTAYDRFALHAFEVQAADYLLKPFDRERFQIALQRGRERVQSDSNVRKQIVAETAAGSEVKVFERLTIKSQGRMIILKTVDIDWICSADNYVELHVRTATHFFRTTIAAIEKKLSPNQFIRISRSLLVNLDRIREIRPKTHGDYLVVLLDGTQLNGSRNFRQSLGSIP